MFFRVEIVFFFYFVFSSLNIDLENKIWLEKKTWFLMAKTRKI